MTQLFARLQEAVAAEQPVVLAKLVKAEAGVGSEMLVYEDGRTEGDLPLGELRDQLVTDALGLLSRAQSQTKAYEVPAPSILNPQSSIQVEVFFDVYSAPPTLFIFGAVHVGVALAHLAKDMGFRVNVIDARGRFATPERFPDADAIVIAHADDYLREHPLTSSSYVTVLSHDPKLDDPALLHALPSRARYVGAIGSRKTNAGRRERLKKAGLTEEQLARLHGGGVGMDINAQTPEEIALSIVAQMVAARNGMDTLTQQGAARPVGG